MRGAPEYGAFHAWLEAQTQLGKWHRREFVSMIPPYGLVVRPSDVVLDMCAAPASKTAQLIEGARGRAGIANELNLKRGHDVGHQLRRAGTERCLVTCQPDQFMAVGDARFDRVLCDVPCSGDGTVRKDAEVGATIAKYTFERILAQSAPILTATEVGAVAQNFAANSEVNIDAFAAAVDVRRDADSDLLGRVVSRMRAELDARKFLLRPVLTRFDRSGSGEIGRMQFLVALQDRHVPLGTQEVEELLRAFPGSGSNTIAISAFCDAVDPVLPRPAADEPPPAVDEPPPAVDQPPSVAPSDKVCSIVGQIGRFAQTLGVDLLDEFHAADRMRHGRIGHLQWRAVIGRLLESELEAVFSAYLVDGRFDYGSFCHDAAAPVQAAEGGSAEFEEALKRCKALLATKMISIDVLFR
jgi:Ca2+-binding EF-hand superfamily protein